MIKYTSDQAVGRYDQLYYKISGTWKDQININLVEHD